MTIRKGSGWGHASPFPGDAPVATSNAELLRFVNDGHTLVGLTGGDLFRTVGGSTSRLRRTDPESLPMHLPVDVIDVELDESRLVSFVTHLIGHDLGWRSIVVAMNVDFWRSYQLGPRSHPGDGVIDVYRAKLSPGDIFKIAPRAKMGLHVPHPKIELQRSSEVLVRVPRQVRLWTDDIKIGTARSLRFSVRPDALTVVI